MDFGLGGPFALRISTDVYRLIEDDLVERFAGEIANELDDFVEASPVGVGVNWTCAMDEAIRAVNWAIGLELIARSQVLDAAFRERAYRAELS